MYFSSQAINHSSNQTCLPIRIYSMLWYNIVPGIAILTNLLVVIAVVQNRRKLRHNYVYLYVINTLIANIFFGIAFAYEITNHVFSFERNWESDRPFWLSPSISSHQFLKRWWAFRSSFIISLFLVMSGSISALIYGIRESSYFVGRKFNQRASDKNLKSRTSPHRWTKMALIILFNWLGPFILNIAAAAGWSCVSYCYCVSGFYGESKYYCHTNLHRECSRVLLPHTNHFLLLTVIIWAVEAAGIVYVLITLINKYLRITGMHKKISLRLQTLSREVPETNPPEKTNEIGKYSDETQQGNEKENKQVSAKYCFKLPSFSYHVKLLLVISVIFIALTFPSMALVVLDISTSEYVLNYNTVFIPLILCLTYCILAPLVLVYYMPGLRLACLNSSFHCRCCTKVTVSASSSSKLNRSTASSYR